MASHASRTIKIDCAALRLQAMEVEAQHTERVRTGGGTSSSWLPWATATSMTTTPPHHLPARGEHTWRRRHSHGDSRASEAERGHDELAFASNVIVSAKYTALNFAPRVLLAQIKRPSNMYFLFIAMLQSVKEVSNTNGVPTILLPLTIVFICSMIKEALEDRERHRADTITNSRMVLALSSKGVWESRKWGDLQVGDIVKVVSGETVPADMFLLSAEEQQHHDEDNDDHDDRDGRARRRPEPQSDDQTPLHEGNLAYVETKSLDGETNLKIRSAIPLVSVLSRTPTDLLTLCGTINCEPPNNRINSFEGTFSMVIQQDKAQQLGLLGGSKGAKGSSTIGQDHHHALEMATRVDNSVSVQFPMTPRQMLLRTCVVRNTKSVTGVVIFTGHETKVFCSNTESMVKSSSVEKKLNGLIIGVVLIQQVICGLGALLGALWMITNGDAHWYLKTHIHTSMMWNKGVSFPYEELVKLHLRYFIIMQNFVPISLNVSLEFVKYWQAYFMEQDLEMYDHVSDTPAMVRSSALNEDLGRVHHVFTDKTGTLTMNLMLFRYCTIGGKHYGGEILADEGVIAVDAPTAATTSKSSGLDAAETTQPHQFVDFDPTDLFSDLHASSTGGNNNSMVDPQAAKIQLFLRHLALCHTLIPAKSFTEMCSSTTPEYSASSPDEQALVAAAAFCNVRFVHRTPTTMTLLEAGQPTSQCIYKIRNVLEFDSDRKRMSIIVETPEGDLQLLCKGADNVILERLSATSNNSSEDVDTALDQLSVYAKAGMRTLCLATKTIDAVTYRDWNTRFQQASSSMEELVKRRQGHVNAIDTLMNEIEKDLVLLGVTAVQDKLQDGVPQTLQVLQQTHIKVWTLTGDKLETAVNIGYACNLLSNEMAVQTMSCDEYGATLKKLQEILVWHAQATALATGSFIARSPSRHRQQRQQRHKKRRGRSTTTRRKADTVLSSSWLATIRRWLTFSAMPTAANASRRRRKRSKKTSRSRGRERGSGSPSSAFDSDSNDHYDHDHDHDSDDDDDDTVNEYGSLLGSSSLSPSAHHHRQASRREASPSPVAMALVIDGATLEFALRPRLRGLFYDVTKICQSVVCCRVSPKQKADIVEFIREFEPQSITLAIGDGANDVAMIQAAHIGVGISGQEGTQAVNASDYAIAQFRFLQRLLFVHGRWAYRRVTKLMSYMLYKNVTYVLTTFWFGTLSGFSGQPLILDIAAQSFNVLFTSVPLVLFAVFDQDISSKSASAFPKLYALGQQNVLLKPRVFWPWIGNGIWHSLVIFFVSCWCFDGGASGLWKWLSNPTVLSTSGHNDSLVTLGVVVFTNLVVVVNLKLCLETFLVTWQFVVTICGSILLWFLVGNLISSTQTRVGRHAIGEMFFVENLPSFWLICVLVPTVSLMRDTIWKMLRRLTFPSSYHILQEREWLQMGISPRSVQRDRDSSLSSSSRWRFPSDGGSDSDTGQAQAEATTSPASLQLTEFAKLVRQMPSFGNERESFRRSSPLAERLMAGSSTRAGSFHGVATAAAGEATAQTEQKAPAQLYHGYAFSEDENIDSDVDAVAASSSSVVVDVSAPVSPRMSLARKPSSSLSFGNSGELGLATAGATGAAAPATTTSTATAFPLPGRITGGRTIKKMIKSVRGPKNA